MELTPKGFEKASDKLTKEQLEGPVDEFNSTPVEEPKEEPAVEEAVEVVEETPVEEEEERKVPFSRFKTVFERATEAERRLNEFNAQNVSQSPTVQRESHKGDLPDYWVTLFGDSDASKEAFQAEQERLSQLEEKAADRAIARLQKQEEEVKEQEEALVSSFNDQFDLLSAENGKDLSDDEKVKVLDIVEEYSPKDEHGRLIRDYLTPVSKAYEIYRLREEAKVLTRKKDRSRAVELTSERSDGTPSIDSSSDFVPGRQRQWENKLPT